MKKIVFIIAFFVAIIFSYSAKAQETHVMILNYTYQQYNVNFSDGGYVGVSATVPGMTTYSSPGPINWAIFNPGPIGHDLYVGDGTMYPTVANSATYGWFYPPFVSTGYTVLWSAGPPPSTGIHYITIIINNS